MKLRKQFYIQQHQKQYLIINVTKEAKDMYTKNYKTGLKEIKDNTNK